MTTVRLDSLFEVTYGSKFDLNKMTRSSEGVNFVGRSSKNLGVTATISSVNGVTPYPAGLITVALGGTKLLCSFIQPKPFYTAQNVAVLRPRSEMSFQEKLFFCLSIRHNRFKYSAFGREANRTLKSLPVPSRKDVPSWVFAATDEAFSNFASTLAPLRVDTSIPAGAKTHIGSDRTTVGDLFDVIYGTNLELNKMQLDPNGINFISRTSQNNGVSARVKLLQEIPPIIGPVLTVAGGGSVLETFLQLDPFYSGRDLYYLKPKTDMSIDELLFYCTCVRANMFRYSYGRQANRTLKLLPIPAPSSIPSWVFGGAASVVEQMSKEVISLA
jgi:hypothetical protein